MEKVNPGYGYRLLQVGERMEPGDEFWSDVRAGWFQRWVTLEPVQREGLQPTRRKIDVGEGFELVPEGATIQSGDEFLCDDGRWEKCGSTIGKIACLKPEGQISDYEAFRRKIQPAEPPQRLIVCQANGNGYQASCFPYAHQSEQSAIKEAQRLTRTHGGKFVVFKAVAAFERETVTTVTAKQTGIV